MAGRDTTATIAQFRASPQYDSILYNQDVSNSTFHSGPVKVERRLGAGPLLLTSYTFGKSIDNASEFGSGDSSEQVLDARDLTRQRAL